MAKSCQTVMALTAMSTKASAAGIFLMILKLDQANVPMTTMNITPTNAAIGICSISGAPKRINDNRPRAATTPESRPRPPELTLMMLWPIIAQPPIPPNKPLIKLALPWAIHSRFPEPLDSVRSSIRFRVIKDSMRPTAARRNAVENRVDQWPVTVCSTLKMSHCKVGSPAWRPSPPPSRINEPTVLTSSPRPMAKAATTMIPVSAAGTTLVTLGSNHMINIVRPTSPIIVYNSLPWIQTFCPSTTRVNMPNWLKKMTIANPLTNPIITGCGIRRTNFPKRKRPASIWIHPTMSRVIKSQLKPRFSNCMAFPTSFPFWMRCTITTAIAPVAPEIIPGRPPKSEVINPIMKAP